MKRGVASGCSASRSGEKDAEGTSSTDAGLFPKERRMAALAKKGERRPALPGIIVPMEPEEGKGKVWTCFRCCLQFDAQWKLLRHKKTHQETAATSTGEKESASTGRESTPTEVRGTTKEDGKEEGGLVTDGREEFQRCDPKSSGSEPLGKSLGGESGRESGALVPRNTGENERKPRNHDCPHCQYSTPHFGALKNHVDAVHLGEKPHKCPRCDYRATRSIHLRRHVSAVHQGQRPHPCPHCEYRATLLHHLKDHVSALHLKERSHECPHCDYRTEVLRSQTARVFGPPGSEAPSVPPLRLQGGAILRCPEPRDGCAPSPETPPVRPMRLQSDAILPSPEARESDSQPSPETRRRRGGKRRRRLFEHGERRMNRPHHKLDSFSLR